MFNKNKKYNILVLGNNGMLGHELYDRLVACSSLKDSNIGTVIGIDVKDGIDLCKQHALDEFLKNSIYFDYCINCVAHTDTKAAETTAEGKALDYKLNALAPKYIAESCKYWKTKLIHISTDYVFSEKSADALKANGQFIHQFKPDSEPFPTNVYGMNKLLGEKFIEEVFGKNSKDYCICRVSWIYGMHNNKSFIHKFMKNIVKSAIENKTECEMTLNEVSVPTSCNYVIRCIFDVIEDKLYGIQHAIPYTEQGVSRLDFANKILDWYNSANLFKDEKLPLANIKLAGIERDSYWPKFSAMNPSFANNSEWSTDLMYFLATNNNGKEILARAKKENNV